jgi:TrmH family RNA methyltransferase
MTSSAVTLIQSRDNALVKDLRRLAQDTTAYRKQGRVWLEGEIGRASCRERVCIGV